MNWFIVARVSVLASWSCVFAALSNSWAVAQPPYDPMWTKQLGTAASDTAVEIDVDAVGNAYVAGRITGVGAVRRH